MLWPSTVLCFPSAALVEVFLGTYSKLLSCWCTAHIANHVTYNIFVDMKRMTIVNILCTKSLNEIMQVLECVWNFILKNNSLDSACHKKRERNRQVNSQCSFKKPEEKKKKERERERDEHFYREHWLFESALKILSVANHCTSVRPAVHADGFSSGAQFLCRHAGMICREEGKQLLLLGWRRIGYVAPRTFCFLGSFLFPCNTLGTLNRSCQCPQLLQEVII